MNVTPHHVEVIAHVAPLVVGLVLLIVLELITAAVPAPSPWWAVAGAALAVRACVLFQRDGVISTTEPAVD